MKVLTLVRSITIGLVVFVGVTFADATNEEEEAVVVADFRSGIPRKLQEPLLSTCTQVGTEPYNTTVYTMVTYQGSNFDFNNIPTLQELEEAFQASYNSYDVCTDRYKNAYKSIGLTFVLSADLTKKQYVLGSRLMTNSNPSTCTGDAQVPKLYEARDRTNTGTDVEPGEDCLCFGPHNESLIERYNNELKKIPFSMIRDDQVVIGMEQLCVSENCNSGTSGDNTFDSETGLPGRTTFDSETGLVTLPCDECTPVGTYPYQSTVYTMVTYKGPNFDFNNIPTLQELEEAFQASYNSYDVCTDRYKNAYKSIGMTFALSADLTKKQYVLGSLHYTNSNPSTCTGGAQVPKLYEAKDRTNIGPDINPGEDCLCFGPHKESLIETYNKELQSSPGSMVKGNQVVIGMEQLCVSANCASGTLDITFDSETGLVTLPCNELETQECTNSKEFNCSKFLKKKKKRGKKCGKFKNGEKIKDLCPEICKKNLCTCIDDFDKFTIKGKISKKFTCAKVSKKNCKKKTGHGFIVRSICPNRCKNTKKCLN